MIFLVLCQDFAFLLVFGSCVAVRRRLAGTARASQYKCASVFFDSVSLDLRYHFDLSVDFPTHFSTQ